MSACVCTPPCRAPHPRPGCPCSPRHRPLPPHSPGPASRRNHRPGPPPPPPGHKRAPRRTAGQGLGNGGREARPPDGDSGGHGSRRGADRLTAESRCPPPPCPPRRTVRRRARRLAGLGGAGAVPAAREGRAAVTPPPSEAGVRASPDARLPAARRQGGGTPRAPRWWVGSGLPAAHRERVGRCAPVLTFSREPAAGRVLLLLLRPLPPASLPWRRGRGDPTGEPVLPAATGGAQGLRLSPRSGRCGCRV